MKISKDIRRKIIQIAAFGFSNSYIGNFRDGSLYQQLLFQGLTRARTKIALVVLDNQKLLARLLGILSPIAR